MVFFKFFFQKNFVIIYLFVREFKNYFCVFFFTFFKISCIANKASTFFKI